MTRKLRKLYIKGGSIWALILGGIIFLSIIFCICVGRDRARLYKADDESIEFIRNRLTNYDRYVTDDRVKSLIRLLDKTNELSDRLAGMDDIDEAFLAQYIYDQRLSGIFVLDDKLELIGNLARGYSSYDMWQEIINSDNVQNIIDYPQKSYMTRVDIDGTSYDFAAVSRTGGKGIVIAYVKKEDAAVGGNDDISSLFTGSVLALDGAVVVTDGKDVLNSNYPVIEDEIAGVHSNINTKISKSTHRYIRARIDNKIWYGRIVKLEKYTIYLFFQAKSIYEATSIIMLYGICLYIIVCMAYIALRYHIYKSNMDKIKKTAEQAERANVAKTDFLRRMSHDIRTPINGIMGLVEISRHNVHDEQKQQECMDKIMVASGFLLELVNNVLDMNKLESGDIKLENISIDYNELLSETVDILDIVAKERAVSISICENTVIHSRIMGSPLHLKQIFQNIISNAVKYNHEGGKVNIYSHECLLDDSHVIIEFVCKDTGCGMSKEFQKKAFDVFTQEAANARTAYAGTGLGLAIVKEIVENMNGTIKLESEPDKGTTFTISIPFEIDKLTEPLRVENKDKGEISIKGVRILLVEDNELNMEIAKFILENEGAQVTEAWNGKEAVDIFTNSEHEDYDVILMDIMMPVMGGYEATECIRNSAHPDAEKIPIFAMTANAFADDVARCKKARMNEHISKPVNARILVSTIARYI